VYGFLSDMRLTFQNCRTFNPVGNHVRTVGDDASDKFEKKWAQGQLEAKWEEERQRYQLELKVRRAGELPCGEGPALRVRPGRWPRGRVV
jgi:hypothetical protein